MSDTIFMIHGMMCNNLCWENYKNFFVAKNFKCITPNLRYHDMNPEDEPDPRIATTGLLDYVDDLEKEIKKLGAPPIIMGHSMGGLLAQILGSRGLAKALVLLTPAAPYGIPALKYSVIKSFAGVIRQWGFWKKSFRFSFDEMVYSVMHLLPRNEQEEAYKRMVYESGRVAFQIGLWMLDFTRASKVDPEKVQCPVLVIAGREDRITPATVVRKVAEKYKHVATYREFANHAHWVIGEPGWEDIAQYIYEWLLRLK
ncbi:alpha/beta hydrolase [Desulfurispora thermophila]|uniref:alpha/beta hydrolase n=1 Tax=Desulfurispora thermophila TaxID=265470 RepID=UPI0003719826|nr:alpha/beta hydrolase [Desulfurispora thermophila]